MSNKFSDPLGKLSRKPYDEAFKDLAEQDAKALLSLLKAIPPNATVTELQREISIQALLTDQPYMIAFAGKKHIVHLEAQTYYEKDLPSRIADYNVRLWLKYQLPVYTYIIVFNQKGMPKKIPHNIRIKAGGMDLTVSFQIACLWQIPAKRALAMKSESLLPFVPLMKGGWKELRLAAQEIAKIVDEIRRRAIALNYVMVGNLRYPLTDLFDLIKGTKMVFPIELLRQSELYQSILKEGREEGREEGGREALIQLLRDMVARRFPGFTLGAEVDRIHNLETLKQICLELDQIPDISTLRQRLAALSEIPASSKDANGKA